LLAGKPLGATVPDAARQPSHSRHSGHSRVRWIDPTNDVLFVGMIQRVGGAGGDDLGGQARTLTYQALVHPEK